MSQLATKPQEERVLVLAPLGRDASLLCQTLEQADLSCQICNGTDLRAEFALGVGVLLLTEEALTPATIAAVQYAVATQPGWSDLPLVLLVNASWRGLKPLGFASTATILERPTRIPTLVTVVRSALTARRRQYQLRDLLVQRENINAQLEDKVKDRTLELRMSNAHLAEEVAEHKKSERALLQSEGRFEKAFRVGPVAACITTLDEGTFVDVNESFAILLGYTHDEVIGKTDKALGLWASAGDQSNIKVALQSGNGYHELELQIRTKAGDYRNILASAGIIDLDTTPCLLHMFYDITERKQTEEAFLQDINEVMQDAAWFSRSLVEKLAQVRAKKVGDGGKYDEVAELTKREKQVLERMAKGQKNAVIAAELGVAEQTIRNYITNLYDKLGVHSRVEAVVWARERGLTSF